MQSNGGAAEGRRTEGTVDGSGLYFSRVVAAGPYAFFGGPAVDNVGSWPDEVRPSAPYHLSPAAHVTKQTKFIFDRLAKELGSLGSSNDEILQVEQFIPRKRYADGYLNMSRGKGAMERRRPASALLACGDLFSPEAVIDPTGIALIPGDGYDKEILQESAGFQEGMRQEMFGETYAEEGPFNEVVAAGPYVFTVGDQVMDWGKGDIPPEVKVGDFVWWGSEIRNETTFLLDRLERYLDWAGATLDDVIHSTVYLTRIEDYFEFDMAWKARFPNNPPARTVIPVRGLGIPRIEAEGLGHADKAVNIEHLTQSIRPGQGATKEIIEVEGEQPASHESVAVKAGDLVWVSSLYANRPGGGLATAPDARSQLEDIFERLAKVVEAGGSSMANLVRVRAFITDPADAYAVYAAVREACPNDPPNVVVTGVPGPLPFPGCTLAIDAVAYSG
jgi:2-iminobutanoate/2-iminopropanoate deaminase